SIPESKYRLNLKNLNLFIPIEFDYNVFKLKSKGRPMLVVFAGPYVANNIGGEIIRLENKVPITINEVAKWDYGIEGGLGFRIPTFSADGGGNLSLKASYYLGLKNTLPKSISGYNDLEMNQYMLTTTGKRMNRGIRISIGYEFSLEKKKRTTFTAGGDGKRTYKRYVIIK
ncbi:MAG: hypothetical protein PF541_14605, partial [Prolixibacteraceae bacterium]|nr:hypothetical protein [Prolixibacteraceae bacterium]